MLQLKSYIENELKQNNFFLNYDPTVGLNRERIKAAGKRFPTAPAGNSVEVV